VRLAGRDVIPLLLKKGYIKSIVAADDDSTKTETPKRSFIKSTPADTDTSQTENQ
jgi:hypothetical protein